MESADRDTFVKMLITAAELYNKMASDVLVKLYWKALQLYPLQDVIRAFELHFEDPDAGQFMPKPADLIKIIKGNSLSQCLNAWSKVEQAIRLLGPYRTVVFDDSIIHAVIHEMGGWIKLCKTSQKEFPFVAKEFQTRYTAYRYNQPNSFPKALTGLTNHQNALEGYTAESPCLIGDADKANLVLEKGQDCINTIQVSQALPKMITHQQPKEEVIYAGTTETIN